MVDGGRLELGQTAEIAYFQLFHTMRMRGLEPPRTCIHTDLNRARLPIPPHPRALPRSEHSAPVERACAVGPVAVRSAPTDQAGVTGQAAGASGLGSPTAKRPGRAARRCFWAGPRLALLASARQRAPLSSRGLGRRPLMAETRVRIPVAVLSERPRKSGVSAFERPGC